MFDSETGIVEFKVDHCFKLTKQKVNGHKTMGMFSWAGAPSDVEHMHRVLFRNGANQLNDVIPVYLLCGLI